MASLTNRFLTNGPVSGGDPGDVTAGSAYRVIWSLIGRAISDAAEKQDENSRKIVDELKNLREHFKQEAEKSPNKRISELPPEVAREFLEVSRLIKDIKNAASRPSSLPPTSTSTRHGYHYGHHHGVVNSAFEGRGPIGVVAMAGADALVPGSGIIVKAVQENSQLIRDTFHAFGHAAGLFRDSFKMFRDTFKAIHNFLDPNHPFGLVKAMSKLFGNKDGGGGILSYLMSTVVGFAVRAILPVILPAIGTVFTAVAGVGLALIIDYLMKKYVGMGVFEGIWELGGLLNKAIDLLTGQNSKNKSGGSTRSFLNPEGGVVPGGQGSQPFNLNTRSIKAPESFNEGFNFNTGIASDESDTIIQLMMKQTQLLGEILRALLSGGGGQGSIRALQSGGTAAPGETVLVGEDGAERIQAGGRSGTVGGPTLLTAGSSPVQVSPRTRSLTVGRIATDIPSGGVSQARAMIGAESGSPGGIRVPTMSRASDWVEASQHGYSETLETTGLPRAAIDAVRSQLQDKESAYTYTQQDKGNSNFGAYQYNMQDVARSAKYLNEEAPTKEQLIASPKLQEKYLDAYWMSRIRQGGSTSLEKDPKFQEVKAKVQAGDSAAIETMSRVLISQQTSGGREALVGKEWKGDPHNKASYWTEGFHERLTESLQASEKPYTPVPRSSASASEVKAAPPQQNASLPVKGGGPTAGDTHRNLSALKAKERQLKSGKDAKQQAPQQPQQGHASPRKQSSHKAMFTNVGMVALSSGSGFG
jgi:hypothetical protein